VKAVVVALGLAVIAGLPTVRADDPAALVERLGAPRYAEREAAAQALEALGREALPALRSARRNDDPEVRARAAALLERIEAAAIIRPTRVRLDFHDRPLGEILKNLEAQSAVPLLLFPTRGDPEALAVRSVTLHDREPVSFWEAIDRLGRTASLRTELRPVPIGDDVDFGVGFETAGPRLAPTSCDGPFRVKLANLSLRRDLDLDSAAVIPGEEAEAASLTGRLLVSGEPRLILGLIGDVRLTEATDDAGRSLLRDEPPEDAERPTSDVIPEFTGGPELNLPLAFGRPPDPKARRIARLRGAVTVAVASPTPEALTVPLGVAGQTVSGEDLVATVEGVRPAEDRNRFVLSLRFSAQPWSPKALAELERASTGGTLFEHQFQVLDRRGRAASAIPMEVEPAEAELRLRILTSLPEGTGRPARLVYRAMTRAVVEVPFDFEDVPLP
jgi:hypothetical protein